ncbi:MAG TPA: hypothetical protein VF462_05355 [Micromonosporaceae bacterium]
MTLVIAALATGALSGASDTAATAVKDAYHKLKLLMSTRLAGRPAGEVALMEHEADPQTWRAPLEKELVESGVCTDPQVIEAAQRLLALLDRSGSDAGKYRVDLRGAQGVQVGDRNHQINRYSVPPHL